MEYFLPHASQRPRHPKPKDTFSNPRSLHLVLEGHLLHGDADPNHAQQYDIHRFVVGVEESILPPKKTKQVLQYGVASAFCIHIFDNFDESESERYFVGFARLL
mgnify:CR=1 FL=1